MKEYFFIPLLNSNYLDFFKKREVFTKSFLIITIVTFITLWSLYSKHNISIFSFYLIIFLSPIFCYTFYESIYHYLFRYNWFYCLFFISSLTLLSITMIELNNITRYRPIIYESLFFIFMGIIGYLIPIILSLPFKLLNHWLFNTNVIYFRNDLTDDIADEFYGRKKKSSPQTKTITKANKYDVMNEIQLQVELTNAISEERFEDADLIKKALEKYR